MLLILLLSLLAGMFLLNEEYHLRSQGMMRHYAMIGGACALGIVAVPNIWLQGLLLLMLFNLLRDPYQGAHHARALPLFLLVLAGVIAYDRLSVESVRWMLYGITMVGVYIAWICLTEWWPNRHHPTALHGWQENQNNVQAVAAICVCAALGYALISPWWAWTLVPVTLMPIAITQYIAARQQGFTVTMAPVVLMGLALMTLPLFIGWWSLLAFFPAGIGLVLGCGQALRYERWWDSGRVRLWFHMLFIGWWRWGLSNADIRRIAQTGINEQGRPLSRHEQKQLLFQHNTFVRLFGRGWQSWMPFQNHLLEVANASRKERQHGLTGKLAQTDVLQTEYFLSTAHNEFVQLLFEHGAVGLLLLSGYIVTSLWDLAHGSLEAQAVYLVAVGVCGVASMLHNLSIYHNTYTPGMDTMFSIGSPGLVWLSFLTVLMVEVVR